MGSDNQKCTNYWLVGGVRNFASYFGIMLPPRRGSKPCTKRDGVRYPPAEPFHSSQTFPGRPIFSDPP